MFARKHRIVRASDFKKIATTGQCFFTRYITLKYSVNHTNLTRFAIVVSNKISKKATERNKLKRRIREILKEQLPCTKTGYDIVVYAKMQARNAQYDELETELKRALKQSQLTV